MPSKATDPTAPSGSGQRRVPPTKPPPRLWAAGVPASPVMSFAALAEDPHLAARQVFIEVEHPTLGRQKVMRAPWLCAGWDSGALRPGPLLAADNDEVLGAIPAGGGTQETEAPR